MGSYWSLNVPNVLPSRANSEACLTLFDPVAVINNLSLFILQLSGHSVTGGGGEVRVGTRRQELKQRGGRNAVHWLAFHGLPSAFPVLPTRAPSTTYPGAAPPTVG